MITLPVCEGRMGNGVSVVVAFAVTTGELCLLPSQ